MIKKILKFLGVLIIYVLIFLIAFFVVRIYQSGRSWGMSTTLRHKSEGLEEGRTDGETFH